MNIRENLISFKKDCLRIVIAITNLMLTISMIFSPENHNFFFWFAFAFRISTVFVALFLGNKWLWVSYFIFCNIKALDPNYNNLIIIGIISVLFALLPKVNKYYIAIVSAVYLTDIFLISEIYHRSGFYIYSTLLLCLQYVTAMWKQKTITENKCKTESKMLVLTPEEIKILDQIKNNEPIKSVEGFSEPTVYRKLTEARERNGFENNNELISEYKLVDKS